MAMQGTHIRFALEVKTEYEIKDLKAYIAGSVYPDSRYLTNTHRDLTHGVDVLKKEFAQDDFKLGWQLHVLYDVIQHKEYEKVFPWLKKSNCGGRHWYFLTALKIIQDIEDFKAYNFQEYLYNLDYFYTPNNESLEKLSLHNEIIKSIYYNKEEITPDDYFEMSLKLGLEKKDVKGIESEILNIVKQEDKLKKIKNLYPRTLEIFYQQKHKFLI